MLPSFATFEDHTLIELALTGRSDCFAALTNRHLPVVRRRIGSMVPDAADLDDVLQEALLKVWSRLSTFRSESSFRTWMTRVAINEVLQYYRRRNGNPLRHAVNTFGALVSPAPSPYQALVRSEATRSVHSAVGALPMKYKRVLVLADLEQLSVRDTARRLESSIPSVKTQLYRGRDLLRRSKLREWVSSAKP